MIDGNQPQQLKLYVNEQLCYDAIVVPGLFNDVVKALRDFRAVLAGEQGKMVYELPAEMINGCDLAMHTFHPEWMLEYGLAIQGQDVVLKQGRMLVDMVTDFEAEPALFSLPEGYRHYQTP